MKIAMLSWESLHSIAVGGVAVHVTELAAALERKGNEVHVFTRIGRGQRHYDRIDGVHYHRCPFDLNPNFIYEMSNNMSGSFVHHLFQVENLIGGFDIVHGHDWMVANALALIKNSRHRKIVFTLHSTEYGRNGNKFQGGSSAIKELEWYGTYIADRVITVSNTLRNEVAWIYNVPHWKLRTIYNGISFHRFNGFIDPWSVKKRYGIGVWNPMVLFVGRMVYQKGPDLLLEAIPHILPERGDAKFVFVGDGDMRRYLEWRASNLRVAHATRFLGYVSEKELLDLYRACDVVCVPSRNEPFGIVVLEAWSAGKPVVAVNHGGPGEIIWHGVNGYKVYSDPHSIAWGIKTIFNNFEHARWMGRKGRETAESAFSWDNIAEQTLHVYKELI